MHSLATFQAKKLHLAVPYPEGLTLYTLLRDCVCILSLFLLSLLLVHSFNWMCYSLNPVYNSICSFKYISYFTKIRKILVTTFKISAYFVSNGGLFLFTSMVIFCPNDGFPCFNRKFSVDLTCGC